MKRHWKKRFLYQRKWWAGTVPFLLFLASCVYMIETKGITKHTILDAAAQYLQANLGYQAVKSCMPVLAYDAAFDAEQITIYEYLAANMDELLPIYGYVRKQEQQFAMGESGLPGEMEDSCGGGSIDALSAGKNWICRGQNRRRRARAIPMKRLAPRLRRGIRQSGFHARS